MKRIFAITLLALSTIMLNAADGKPRIGLVLGGGGAKGAAEVGVLKVLEEMGFRAAIMDAVEACIEKSKNI